MDTALVILQHDTLRAPFLIYKGKPGPIGPDAGKLLHEFMFFHSKKTSDPAYLLFFQIYVARPPAACRAALAHIVITWFNRHAKARGVAEQKAKDCTVSTPADCHARALLTVGAAQVARERRTRH